MFLLLLLDILFSSSFFPKLKLFVSNINSSNDIKQVVMMMILLLLILLLLIIIIIIITIIESV